MEDRNISAIVLETGTEISRRQHYFAPRHFGDRAAVHLPAQEKLVVVKYVQPGDGHERTASISPKGYALWESRRDYTYPSAVDRSGLTDRYPDAQALEANYAASFKGALAVTEFVADSLAQTHGIQSETGELKRLQEEWQRVASVEMHPNVEVLLPRRSD